MDTDAYLAERRARLDADVARIEEERARITALETHAARYRALMVIPDADLISSWQKLLRDHALSKDPVYTSSDVSEPLKEALRTRTLKGFTEERLEDEYKRVLYGISIVNKNRLVLASDAEGTPIQFEPGFLRRTGYSSREMIDLCRRCALDEEALVKLQDYETQHGIAFKPLANLLPKGYSIDDVGTLLQVRQALLAKDSRVSLDTVVRFREKFKGMETELGLADWISLAHDGLKLGSIDASVTRLLDKATELRMDDFDTALEAAKKPDPKRPPWG